MSRLVYVVTSSISVPLLCGQLRFMRRRGYDVHVISSPGKELPKVAGEEDAVAIEVPMEREISPAKDCLALWRLWRQFRSLRPEVVAAATPKAGLLSMIAAWLARVPVRVYLQFGLRLETTRGLKRWVLAMTERVACACATRVICISESLRTRCVELRLVPARKAVVLGAGSHAGLDAERFKDTPQLRQEAAAIRARLQIPPDAPVVGFVGRLTRDKGTADLVAAFEKLLTRIPQARLLLVGDFESGDPLPEECVCRLNAHPQIVRTGFVDDPLPYYGAMNVMAFPSYREGFGTVVLEAASVGLPVAGYRATGTVDSAADGVTGTLVDCGDVEALAEAILRYLQSPELSRRHGQAGRERVVRDFRPEAVWEAFCTEFCDLRRRAGLPELSPSPADGKPSSVPVPIPAGSNGSPHRLPTQKPSYLLKRGIDILAAGIGLVLLAPLLAVIALAVRLTMGRPVLFRQERPGFRGRPFVIYKFRTMRELCEGRDCSVHATTRLTRLGRFLRDTSLDELPELVNVLRGQMSLVGPRPLLMAYLDRYSPEQARRHDILPGITGWAQVQGRNATSWEERFRQDVWYVDHWSLWLDLRILALTFWTVLRRNGVNSGAELTMPEFTGLGRPAPAEASAAPSPLPRIFLSPPHMSEEERTLLLDAFDSNWIAPLGPHVDAFEREFAQAVGAEHAVALSSGTAALHLALLTLGIQEGDQVATATMTFAATANAIRYVGATPVFIDCHPQSWNLDPDLLAEELEDGLRRGRPLRAVLAVDLFGHCADYEPIRRLCRFYEIPLIEDAAEALGASYGGRSAGMLGDIGCFSFNGNKIITTSGGGMLVTASKAWADKVRYLATQARDPVAHYEHSAVGYNYRMSNLLAAVGRGQLRLLNDRVRQRRANYAFYREALADLPGISFMPENSQEYSTRWLTCILVDPERFGATREEIRLAMERKNIETRAVWKPMHLQPVYADYRVCGGQVAERWFREGLCLPSGSNLTRDDLARVVEVIREMAVRGTAARSRKEHATGTAASVALGKPLPSTPRVPQL